MRTLLTIEFLFKKISSTNYYVNTKIKADKYALFAASS